jgi:hypothetical protein
MTKSPFSKAMGIFESPSFSHEQKRAQRLIAGLFGQDGYVRFKSFRELDGYIQNQQGFKIVKAAPLLDNNKNDTLLIQWFYRYGHVWVRLKNQPRRGTKSGHMAVVLADGEEWDDEVGKFSRTGQLMPKQGFVMRLALAGDERSFWKAGKTQKEVFGKEDAWADACHFNLVDDFNWSGGEKYV